MNTKENINNVLHKVGEMLNILPAIRIINAIDY